MRDPKRIEETLKVIEFIWKQWPDLRLGQLISNIAGGDDKVFYIEDDALMVKAGEFFAMEL